MRLGEPGGAELLDPGASDSSQSWLMPDYQDLASASPLTSRAFSEKQAPSQLEVYAALDQPNKQVAAMKVSPGRAVSNGPNSTAESPDAACSLHGSSAANGPKLQGASATLLSMQHQPNPEHRQRQQADPSADTAGQHQSDSCMMSWEKLVLSHLTRQTALCLEHRSSSSRASEIDKAQAFSRLVLLQGMQRVAAATRATATYPTTALQNRLFGIPGDEAALDHANCFKALIELDRAFQRLPDTNCPAAVASEALVLWRTLLQRASSLPSFRNTSLSGRANGSSAAGKATPITPAFISCQASGTRQDRATTSKVDASGTKSHLASKASSSGLTQHAGAQQDVQQAAASEPAAKAQGHIRTMIPEELLPMIYVTWEFETMQMWVPSWHTLQAACQHAQQGKAAEPAAIRRAREARAFQEVCAEAAAKNHRPSDEDVFGTAPRLVGSCLYMTAVGQVKGTCPQKLATAQQDDRPANPKPAGCMNAACPAGMPRLYYQVAKQAASEVQSWAKAKGTMILAARSKQSKLVQRTLSDAKKKHAEMQEYINVLEDAVALAENYMLRIIAGDCPPGMTLQWIEKARRKPGQTGILFHASFEQAWSSVMGYYQAFSSEDSVMETQLGIQLQMREVAMLCSATINSCLIPAIGCMDQLLAKAPVSAGHPSRLGSKGPRDKQALPAAELPSSSSAAMDLQNVQRSDEVAEALLQEEAAESAAAARKREKAQKKRQAQRKASLAPATRQSGRRHWASLLRNGTLTYDKAFITSISTVKSSHLRAAQFLTFWYNHLSSFDSALPWTNNVEKSSLAKFAS